MKQLFSTLKILGVVALSVIGVAAFNMSSQASSYEDGIAERLAPVGTVCVKGEACAASIKVASAGPRSAEEIYNASCLACHTSGAAGAPKFRDAADWGPRLAKGMDTLYANSINGINAMPAKGLCGTCSDEELNATVDYMIEGL